jgi:Cofilin/tropomyosin-type actin-binding protein
VLQGGWLRPAHICMDRSPDTAKIRDKMVFASSTEALRRAVNLASVIQATDTSEVEYATSQYLQCFSSVECTN